eukprot:3667715-Rhodomonas_salina.3
MLLCFQEYQPTITSYDYDNPLSEAGDITPKYKDPTVLRSAYAMSGTDLGSRYGCVCNVRYRPGY